MKTVYNTGYVEVVEEENELGDKRYKLKRTDDNKWWAISDYGKAWSYLGAYAIHNPIVYYSLRRAKRKAKKLHTDIAARKWS